MVKILVLNTSEGYICYNVTSDYDYNRAVSELGAVELPEEKIIALGMKGKEHLVSPETTVVVDGEVIAFNPPPDTELDATAADVVRILRNNLLTATDYLAMPDYPLTAEQREELYAYRTMLRNLPQQEGFPWRGRTVPWPIKPSFVP